ncbi:MAG: hypothetical protein KAH77_08785 [Thiomargarita sp.]|nr:hypothetical protein [Thiomargarita sp.]
METIATIAILLFTFISMFFIKAMFNKYILITLNIKSNDKKDGNKLKVGPIPCGGGPCGGGPCGACGG